MPSPRAAIAPAWDEPFYAAYLTATGIDHPMRDEIIAAGETDPARVAAACAGPIPQTTEPVLPETHDAST